MLNSIEAYQEAGEKSAQGQIEGDYSRFEFERNWYRKARLLESAENRAIADRVFRSAYKARMNKAGI